MMELNRGSGRRRNIESPAGREAGYPAPGPAASGAGGARVVPRARAGGGRVSGGGTTRSFGRSWLPRALWVGSANAPLVAGIVVGALLWCAVNLCIPGQPLGDAGGPGGHEPHAKAGNGNVRPETARGAGGRHARGSSAADDRGAVGLQLQGADGGAGAAAVPTHPAKETVHVAITMTLSHAVGVVGVINSSLRSAADPGALRFHVMLPPVNRYRLNRMLQELFPAESKAGQFLTMPYSRRTHAVVRDPARYAALSQDIVYARYYFADLFPELKRIIYLDADVVVQGDLRELWDTDTRGKPLAAVPRCRTRFERAFGYGSKEARRHLSQFSKSECVFNNGVMLYDLAAWRSSSPPHSDELVRWTALNLDVELYSLGSQPPFNLVFYRNYFKLDPAWNVMDAGEPSIHPNAAEAAAAKVLHWNGEDKPWRVDPRTLYSERFTRHVPQWETLLPETDEFTMVVVTQGLRVAALERVVRHMSRCEQLYAIVLVWNHPDAPCPDALMAVGADLGVDMRCVPRRGAGDVQARLLVAGEISTEAVLQHDDDAMLRLEDVSLGLRVWKRNRDRIVGFEPRVHRHDADDGWSYGFHLSEGYYTLVIGKFFFVARRLMEAYAADAALVEANRGVFCEDIAINFLAAKRNGGKGCLVVQSNHWELPTNASVGLSTRVPTAQWSAMRQRCVGLLSEHFSDGFLRSFPRTTEVVMGYDAEWNTIVSRPVVKGESVCADANGVRTCRVPECAEAKGRLPCYNKKH